MKPDTCTDCRSDLIAPCGPAHRDAGLHWFCVKCSTFYGENGAVTTPEPMAVRRTLADRLQDARPDIAHVLRHGGALN